MVEHARRELELLGEDEWTKQGVLNVVQAFADMGHSGGSASVIIPMINDLLNHRNLTPLTDDPKEWVCHDKSLWGAKGYIWQNLRNSSAFSVDGGKTYQLADEKRWTGRFKVHKSKKVT